MLRCDGQKDGDDRPAETGTSVPPDRRRAPEAMGMERATILDRSRTEPARRFNALGDPARQAILEELRGGTRCLCELEADLGLASNLLSYHMRVLREAGLVSGSRRGRRVEYRIEEAGLDRVRHDVERLSPDGGFALSLKPAAEGRRPSAPEDLSECLIGRMR